MCLCSALQLLRQTRGLCLTFTRFVTRLQRCLPNINLFCDNYLLICVCLSYSMMNGIVSDVTDETLDACDSIKDKISIADDIKRDDLSQDDQKSDSNESDHDSDDNDQHLAQVLYCLRRSDIKGLKLLATRGNGFMTDQLRQKIWPKLLKVSVIETSPRPDTQTIESHPFYNQVILDVNRSLKRFPPCIGESQRISMQDSLIRLIMRVLIKNPELHYFQGYHDICVTFLMILGEEMAFYCVNQLSKSHFRVFMEKTMEKTSDLMDIISILVKHENRALSDHLEQAEVGTIFALSWVITWFSHVLPTYEDLARLFDFFIVSHSLMPLYLTAALVLYKHREILNTDCDMPSIHHLLTRVPETEELPIESLIETALDLFDKYPPNDMIKQQEEVKKNRLRLQSRRRGQLRRLFDFRYLIHMHFKFNLVSVTLLVVIFAIVYQFYWNI